MKSNQSKEWQTANKQTEIDKRLINKFFLQTPNWIYKSLETTCYSKDILYNGTPENLAEKFFCVLILFKVIFIKSNYQSFGLEVSYR